MSQTNGTGDLNSLSQADLTETYNKLAAAAKKPTVKSFKDKATAVKRIQALQDEVAEPSAAQKEASAKALAEAGAGQKASDAPAAKKVAAKKAKDTASIAASKAAFAAAKKVPAKKAAAKPAAKAPAKKASAQKPEAGEKKPRGSGIGAFCMELIGKGKSNEEVLAAVKTKFPDAATSASSVAWYRNKLKQDAS